MTTTQLVLGLDGADLTLVERFGPSALPTLHRLMQQGAYAALESVQPPATLPNWTTFLTGTDPGVHGVFDFTARSGSTVRFTGGTIREVPTVAARLDRMGHTCAVVGFPGTWPPEPLERGVFVSGWDSPVAFEADRSFVHPRWMYDAIRERFGTPRFDDVDEFAAETDGWHAQLVERLIARIQRKTALAKWLMRQRRWDLFAFYFGESDTASHHLWSIADPDSPRHPGSCAALSETAKPDYSMCAPDNPLRRVYCALDDAVDELLHDNPNAELTIVSDHGSGGASDKVLYLNRALAEASLLAFRGGQHHGVGHAAAWAKDRALTRLPSWTRERLFRFNRGTLPNLVESRARFGAIDFKRTVAFSDELNYFPAIHINRIGREPHGTVSEKDADRVISDVGSALRALTDPWTGKPILRALHHREDLFSGSFVERAPDLLVEFELDGDYSYNLQPSACAPPGTGAWRRLSVAEHLGRKGRSLPGSHRPYGLYIAAGPSVAPVGRVEAHIADTTATLLTRMGVAVPNDAAGRVLWEILAETNPSTAELPSVSSARSQPKQDERSVERRLRALGYVD